MVRKVAPAMRAKLKTESAVKALKAFVKEVEKEDFKAWRRAKAV